MNKAAEEHLAVCCCSQMQHTWHTADTLPKTSEAQIVADKTLLLLDRRDEVANFSSLQKEFFGWQRASRHRFKVLQLVLDIIKHTTNSFQSMSFRLTIERTCYMWMNAEGGLYIIIVASNTNVEICIHGAYDWDMNAKCHWHAHVLVMHKRAGVYSIGFHLGIAFRSEVDRTIHDRSVGNGLVYAR